MLISNFLHIVLRNSSSAASALWTTFQLAWAWRYAARASASRRTLPIIICAALSASAFMAAGGFSSWISSGIGNEVLLDGANCGIIDSSDNVTAESSIIFAPYMSQLTSDASNYAQQCYTANTTGDFACTSYIKDHLQGTIDNAAPCPFDDSSLCRSNNSNLRLDTGFTDSSKDLGLNTPDDQRLLFRKVLHCAPLVTTGFVSNVSTSQGNFTRYWYGATEGVGNYTHQVQNLDAQYSEANEGNKFLLK